MIRRPPRSTQSRSSAASDVYKRQALRLAAVRAEEVLGLNPGSPLGHGAAVDGLARVAVRLCQLAADVGVLLDRQRAVGRGVRHSGRVEQLLVVDEDVASQELAHRVDAVGHLSLDGVYAVGEFLGGNILVY